MVEKLERFLQHERIKKIHYLFDTWRILMSRKFTLYLALVLLVLLAGCAKRNTAFEDANKLSLLATVPVVGNPTELGFDSTHLYVALDQGGLAAINTANYHLTWYPTLLSEDGSVTELWRTRKLSIVPEQNRLFLTEIQFTDKVHIIDTSDPDTLKVFDSITGGTFDIQDVVARKIENPTDANVIEITFCASTDVSFGRYNGNIWLGTDYTGSGPALMAGVDMNDTHIFGAGQQRGLFVFDKANGHFISEVAISGEAQKVKVSGNYAYIAARQGGLQVVDITNPNAPVKVGGYTTSGYASGVDVFENYVAISSGSGGAYVFDVSTPANPKLVQRITDCGYANAVKFNGNRLAIASRDNGIFFYQID